jgi:hypothetical protein
MTYRVKYKSMLLLLPLLAACSGNDGGSDVPATAALPQLDTAVASQGISQPAVAVKPLTDFDLWAKRLMADSISPVIPAQGDLTETWTGADGKLANVVVRVPRTAGKPTVSVTSPDNGGDATPIMQQALAQLRKSQGGILKIAPGEYHFKTGNQADQAGLAQFLVSRLKDVDIQGAGAKFFFETNCDGILVEDSQRVRIQGVSIEDPRVLSGYGRMHKVNGTTQLELDKPLPDDVTINWVQPINEGSRTWPQTSSRTILTPSDAQPTRLDDRTFVAPTFKNIKDGQYVSVKFTWYAKRALYVLDTSRGVNEDVIFDGVHVGSVGGMGLLVRTRGRGVALINSSISASADRPYSTNYDGVHVIAAAGDVLLRGNSFAHTGDDQINLRSIIHKVDKTAGDQVTLSNFARIVRVGDEVAFFTATGEYVGKRVIKAAPPLGNSDTITFDVMPGEPISEAVYARDINSTPRRFAVVNNTMMDSAGRGMLIQVPDGLVKGNSIRRLPSTAIRMLTSFNPWLEGAGAINVRVTGNTIDDGGAALNLGFVTGIITALGEVIQSKLPAGMQNGPIKIDNNKFIAPRAACIVIYNTKGIVQENNVCGGA